VVEASYEAEYHKNEDQLLRTLVADGRVSIAYADPAGRFTVYDIGGLTAATVRPTSIGGCHL
jgi:hypothetical protein